MRPLSGSVHLQVVCIAGWVCLSHLGGAAELPFEPTIVAVPPANAFRSMLWTGDGSINSNGFIGTYRKHMGLVRLRF